MKANVTLALTAAFAFQLLTFIGVRAEAAGTSCPVSLVRADLARKLAASGAQTKVIRALDFDELVAAGGSSTIYGDLESLNLTKQVKEDVQVFTSRVSGVVGTSYLVLLVRPQTCEIIDSATLEIRPN